VRARRRLEGLTIVEAAILVCIAGSVLAVFVPTFVSHLRTSKIAEASEQLGELHARAASYHAAVQRPAEGRRAVRCLPPAAGPAPAGPSEDPVTVDFAGAQTPGHATWRALAFQPQDPIRYRYTFVPSVEGCDLDAARRTSTIFRAEGDLDADGVLSTFERRARVDARGDLVPEGILYVEDRVE
jgi:hypothetical protein